MEAPREVFVLESLNGKLWIHSSKGPLLFLEVEHAEEALAANGGVLDKKWSIMRVSMSADLSSAPFRNHEAHKCDTIKLPANSIFLSDLRDQVALAANAKRGDDIEVVGSIKPQPSADAEYLELRAKLKALGVNVRAIRKLPRLRAMLVEAEAAVAEAVSV